MATQIQLRRDITTAWNTEDPVLADGELAFDKTNKILKMGEVSREEILSSSI